MSCFIDLQQRDKLTKPQAQTETHDYGNSIFRGVGASYPINNNFVDERLYCHSQKTEGFTLLELIVVCALIGIMLTISIPSLRSAFFTNPLKSTARQVVGLINEVRQTAVRSQEPYNLYISQLENRIWYEKAEKGQEDSIEDSLETDKKNELQLPDTVTVSRVWTQGSGVLSEDKTTIWISKKGYMEHTAIQLSDELSNSLAVQLNPFTDPIAVTNEFPPSSP